MTETESDETVTVSRADTISRTEWGTNDLQLQNANGAHAQLASEVQANEDHTKLS